MPAEGKDEGIIIIIGRMKIMENNNNDAKKKQRLLGAVCLSRERRQRNIIL